ncbi:ABC transporter ATP-binding protein [Nocardiopsis changdeensis]|uniref:ABC transporter ATP-binding protein n=1 Tax=Nocardiopsis changdeensis TaxID=2831969 RepID=A0ABX8BRM8_9ACTN|nr:MULTISPECIES: ABC transporter ATP-binding protein [Nocardiopsis]QUX24890.1 ABC transporter ATP-binding protein [Nocardiopsis changdeensis]QYX35276.1 ABC transporter ATP-binding protein [Nocardiopsis sp. MT53]
MQALEISGLTRTYRRRGGEEFHALRGLDLDVPRGEVHGLLGPNGAGKTTLCKIVSTVLLPTAGTVRVLGHDVVTDTARVKERLGIVFGGEKGLYERLTARQNLTFWASLYGLGRAARRRRVDELLERVGLADRADERAGDFSRGMKQRLHLARGLVSDPGVLILDEPTVGMDPVAARDFRALVGELRGRGTTVLMTTHDMAEAAALSDRVSLIDRGTLVMTESPAAVGDLVSAYERVDARGVPGRVRESLAGLPGVVSVTSPEEGLTRVETSSPDATLAVQRALVEARVRDVARSRPDLEEVYLHLVGERGMAVGE